MTIDLETERIIPIRQVHKHCPGSPHLSAIYRWTKRAKDPLETIKVGGRRYTSIEAIHRFIRRCSGEEQSVTSELSARRKREIEQAQRELAADGI